MSKHPKRTMKAVYKITYRFKTPTGALLNKKYKNSFVLVVLKPHDRAASQEEEEKRRCLESKGRLRTISYEGDFCDWLSQEPC
jgi:hypothetical protein